MAKRRGTLLIILSLVLAFGAAWTANRLLSSNLAAEESAETGTLVVAAAMAIPYGTKVEERHLKFVEIPEDVAPTGFFTAIDQVEGTVSTVAIARNEILVAERFARHETGSTLAALVGENMRAVTVRVNDVIGVAGFLLPGNRVDILASRKSGVERRATTETILRNIKVLAVDQSASTESNEPVIVRAVTLEMTPQQAEAVVRARAEGEIQLTLRNPLDKDVQPEPEPEPVVVAAAPAPKPAPRPVARPRSSTTTVTVIRGTQVDTEKAKE